MTLWKLPSTTGRAVCIVGAGVLGRRIGACWVAAGYRVRIRDIDREQIDRAVQYIEQEFWRYKPTIDSEEIDVEGFEDLETALDDSWLVIECIPEDIGLKQAVFVELEDLVEPDAILATNSSSYKSREIAAKVHPETARRVLNMHYFLPPDIRIVELMTSGSTHQEIFPFLQKHLRLSGILPFVARQESAGLILNRVWAAIKRECLMVLSEGVVSPKELDAVWTELFVKTGIPPCELMDSVGLDTVSLIEQHYIAERRLYDPGVISYLQKFIDEGKLGAKSSKGGLYPPKASTSKDHTQYDKQHVPALYLVETKPFGAPTDQCSLGRILVGRADGKSPLRPIVTGQPMLDGIAVCVSAGKLFWVSVNGANHSYIMSANLDGSDRKVIVSSVAADSPRHPTVDNQEEKLYFSDCKGIYVFRTDLDGSNLETVIRVPGWTVGGQGEGCWSAKIAVATNQGKFYWTQRVSLNPSRGRILRASIEMPRGCNASTRPDIECVVESIQYALDLEVDEDGERIYWADKNDAGPGYALNCAVINQKGQCEDRQTIATEMDGQLRFTMDKTGREIYVSHR